MVDSIDSKESEGQIKMMTLNEALAESMKCIFSGITFTVTYQGNNQYEFWREEDPAICY